MRPVIHRSGDPDRLRLSSPTHGSAWLDEVNEACNAPVLVVLPGASAPLDGRLEVEKPQIEHPVAGKGILVDEVEADLGIPEERIGISKPVLYLP